jgi:hypothetical protein
MAGKSFSTKEDIMSDEKKKDDHGHGGGGSGVGKAWGYGILVIVLLFSGVLDIFTNAMGNLLSMVRTHAGAFLILAAFILLLRPKKKDDGGEKH